MLHRQGQVRYLLEARPDHPVGAWIKFDTGMHRLGFDRAGADAALEQVQDAGHGAETPVLCTHLACADERESPVTPSQLTAFRQLADRHSVPVSVANSAGLMYWPASHGDWNRPGYMLYGHCPDGGFDAAGEGLRPAMRLVSEVMALRRLQPGEAVGYGQRWRAQRPSLIGTIPIGYADGYPRHAPDGTPVLVRGQRVPLAGTVSMDMITVDLTDLPEAAVGDPVELWGEDLSVNEVAAQAGTIGYELLAGLTGRVPISYTHDGLS
jgi:alanine racemase